MHIDADEVTNAATIYGDSDAEIAQRGELVFEEVQGNSVETLNFYDKSV